MTDGTIMAANLPNGRNLSQYIVIIALILGGASAYNSTDTRTEIDDEIEKFIAFVQRQIDDITAEISDARLDIDDLRDRMREQEQQSSRLLGEFEEYKRSHP